MTGEPRSPWLARSILSLLLPDRYRDNQLGDLEEEFRARGRRNGWAKARRWYWLQAATSLPSTGVEGIGLFWGAGRTTPARWKVRLSSKRSVTAMPRGCPPLR